MHWLARTLLALAVTCTVQYALLQAFTIAHDTTLVRDAMSVPQPDAPPSPPQPPQPTTFTCDSCRGEFARPKPNETYACTSCMVTTVAAIVTTPTNCDNRRHHHQRDERALARTMDAYLRNAHLLRLVHGDSADGHFARLIMRPIAEMSHIHPVSVVALLASIALWWCFVWRVRAWYTAAQVTACAEAEAMRARSLTETRAMLDETMARERRLDDERRADEERLHALAQAHMTPVSSSSTPFLLHHRRSATYGDRR